MLTDLSQSRVPVQHRMGLHAGPGVSVIVIAVLLLALGGCQRYRPPLFPRLAAKFCNPVPPPCPQNTTASLQCLTDELQWCEDETPFKPVRVTEGPASIDLRTSQAIRHVIKGTDPVQEVGLFDVQLSALSSRVIRRNEPFLSGANPLTVADGTVTTAYDNDITNTGFLFGQRGRQAALADFDPTLSGQLIWGRDERIQNNQLLSGGVRALDTLTEETAVFSTRLQKSLRRGGQLALIHDINYLGSNRPVATLVNPAGVAFPSVYFGDIRTEFRQPLLAGAGRRFTDIVGPLGQALEGVSGLSQGVEIANYRQQIERLAYFNEIGQQLRDVTQVYWQLAQSLRALEYLSAGKRAAESTVEIIDTRYSEGMDATLDQLLEAQSIVAAIQSEILDTQRNVDELHARLVRLSNSDVTRDTKLIPVDKPSTAPIIYDKDSLIQDAMVRQPLLLQQQLRIKSANEQLFAAKKLLLPRLDFVSSYHVNGFGDHLLGEDPASAFLGVENVYATIFRGKQTGWTTGFEFAYAPRRRLEWTRVRNLRAQVMKQRLLLREQEKEFELELSAIVDDLDRRREMLAQQRYRVDLLNARRRTLEQQLEDDSSTRQLLRLAGVDSERANLEARYAVALGEFKARQAELAFKSGRYNECVDLH